MKTLLFLIASALLLVSCSSKMVSKTRKTTLRQVDTILVIPSQQTSFISRLPTLGDSIVLNDEYSGIRLIITEYVSLDTLLTFWPISEDSFLKPKTNSVKPKKYNFKVLQPEKLIPVKINETVLEITQSKSSPITPWYYKLSFKILVFSISVFLLIYLLKRFLS